LPLLDDYVDWLSAYFESNVPKTLLPNCTHRGLPAFVFFSERGGVSRHVSSHRKDSRSSGFSCNWGTREPPELRRGSDSRSKKR
jgi:hypothetical protein